jgi:hypothetical protein
VKAAGPASIGSDRIADNTIQRVRTAADREGNIASIGKEPLWAFPAAASGSPPHRRATLAGANRLAVIACVAAAKSSAWCLITELIELEAYTLF